MKDEPEVESQRKHTSKQMGDACEQLIAAELTLAGVPAIKAPDNWPYYDVIAQPLKGKPQRISVKARHYKPGAAYFQYNRGDKFDWIAMVILPRGDLTERQYYVVPRRVADRTFTDHKDGAGRGADCRIQDIEKKFGAFRENFTLNPRPRKSL